MNLFDRLSGDDRAVSPVIGVVLMIAVVVILAAVVGAFATGVFGNQNSAPQASFSYDAANTQVVMESGDAIDSGNLYTKVGDSGRSDWGGTDTSGEVTAGSTSDVSVSSDTTVQVIWDDGNGNSAVLGSFDAGGSSGS
ncbi:type IV pilin [Halococcus saccharolyticus]|uniref:Archaeal Type IV pilin N-terminal domain-containing protein n=1 Tax=Halococcus saccharolyticus DSM 5350 TaxID=1227455 RepID=M0MLB3_9EURY|nr:type IV pilin N-terminal domain-containing protein [Halococcus saccharolyticus]EMA45499.1 hypothetical protein C449_07760 [Halococcus saccharolyticus DSM 5350]